MFRCAVEKEQTGRLHSKICKYAETFSNSLSGENSWDTLFPVVYSLKAELGYFIDGGY